MKLLFLTLVSFNSINDRNLYTDLMRKFRDEGHDVFIVIPTERRFKQNTSIISEERVTTLKIKTPNIQKTNILEKGISTLLIESLFLKGIKKYFSGIKFDLIIYSTPPITFSKVISYIKQRDNALSYLLLKDIFPQNAVDLGMMKKNGILHCFFRQKEKRLYQLSDFIGCMSPANVAYLRSHNPWINEHKVEVNPNSIEPSSINLSFEEKAIIKKQYIIPENATTFIYGGNLGKPQGINFLINVLQSNLNKTDRYFIIAGSGTERTKIEKWFSENNPSNALLIEYLPKESYDKLLAACDVGMIFLDQRFTIPNYPSRLLTYLENRLPVVMATDVHTDIGKIAEENGYGLWCQNGDLDKFNSLLDILCLNQELRKEMGEKGFQFLMENCQVEQSIKTILSHF